MSVTIVGTLCFGALMGWVTYRTLRRRDETVSVSSIASVACAVGGAAVVAFFFGRKPFAWYSIGLAGSFFFGVILNAVLQSTVKSAAWAGDAAYARQHRLEIEFGAKTKLETLDLSSLELSLRYAPQQETILLLKKELERMRTDRLLPRPAEHLLLRSAYPSGRPPRYANAALFVAEKQLPQDAPLSPGKVVRLRLDIGPLSLESQVSFPELFPDWKLPPDIDLDVMVSSTDFVVASKSKTARNGQNKIAHGRFFLPGDGRPAKTPSGRRYLGFYLRTPDGRGQARARIGYYYRNILVQSQLLVADVGQSGGFTINTDFTLSDDLTRLEDFPTRPRISVLTNANGDGTHQIILRKPGATLDSAAEGETFAVAEKNIGKTVDALRAVLRERAPTTRRRGRAELAEDLRELAPKGLELWGQIPAQHVHMFAQLRKDPASFVVHVSRPTTSSFVFPWALIYDIPLNIDRPDICLLVAKWDGKSPLISASTRQCPYGPHTENVLCPFGFWGFRYSIEQLSSTKDSVFSISAPDAWDFVVAETQYGINLDSLSDHVEELRTTVRKSFPRAQIREGKTKTDIRTLLGQDLPIVYFYCHGEKSSDADANTYLGVGNNESLKALEFQGWVQTWSDANKVVWNQVRPLVFVNACHSLEIHPETLISYLDAFVGTARAAGVIGTEVKVDQGLAMKVAERFFALLLAQENAADVDQALRTIRLEYLADGNLLGLLYTPYCWAELHVTHQPAKIV